MHVRVVRFTDATPDKVDELVARIEESDGPPPGVPATALSCSTTPTRAQRLSSSTSTRPMTCEPGNEAFGAMDPSETPGTRASVDMSEQKLDVKLS